MEDKLIALLIYKAERMASRFIEEQGEPLSKKVWWSEDDNCVKMTLEYSNFIVNESIDSITIKDLNV